MRSPDEVRTLLLLDYAPANIQIANSILKDTLDPHRDERREGIGTVERLSLTDPILPDDVTPEMDGYEVCRRLKIAAETREIPVLRADGSDSFHFRLPVLSVTRGTVCLLGCTDWWAESVVKPWTTR